MSLIHRRKSAIFNAPSSHPPPSSTYKIKVQSIIDSYKNKFSFNHSSIETQKKPIIEKLSLSQAKKLQKLHQQILKGPRVSSALTKTSNCNYDTIIQPSEIRKKSLHVLLEGYQRNIPVEVEDKNTIDPERLELFRKGKFYRSKQRASGAGVCKVSKQSLAVYYKFNDNPQIQVYEEPKLIEKSISKRPFSTLDSRCDRGKSYSTFSNSRARDNQRSQRSHRIPINQGNELFSTLPLRSTFKKDV